MYITRLQYNEKSSKKIGSYVYTEAEELPLGVLSTKEDVIRCMLYLLRKDRAGKYHRDISQACYLLACSLSD